MNIPSIIVYSVSVDMNVVMGGEVVRHGHALLSFECSSSQSFNNGEFFERDLVLGYVGV